VGRADIMLSSWLHAIILLAVLLCSHVNSLIIPLRPAPHGLRPLPMATSLFTDHITMAATGDAQPVEEETASADEQAVAEPDSSETTETDVSAEGEQATEEKENKDEDEGDEDEDDLLGSPAFLKQKINVLKTELKKVNEEVETARAERKDAEEEWQQRRDRLQTDFDNFNARNYNQTLEAQIDAKVKRFQEFMPVLDNFDRARNSISTEGDKQTAANEEYQAMRDHLMETLKKEMGVTTIPTVGEEFDYNLHMAMQNVPSDEYDENIVCSEMQAGYMCSGKLVRAAYVMVSSGPM